MKKFYGVFLFVVIGFSTFAQTYCSVSSSCNSGDRLDSTIIGSTLLTSSQLCSTNGYSISSISAGTIRLKPNTSYSFIFKLQKTSYSEGIAVFIDLNHDGDFVDANEKVFNTPTLVQGINGNVLALINMPATSYTGTTRMRIRVKYNNNTILPCETYSYGETEDYPITIESNNGSNPNEIYITKSTFVKDTAFFSYNGVTIDSSTFNSPTKDIQIVSQNKILIKPGTLITKGTNFFAVIDTVTTKESGDGIIEVLDTLENKFIPLTQLIRLKMTGASFSSDLTKYQLYKNDVQSQINNFTHSANLISFKTPLSDGKNIISLRGQNTLGKAQNIEFIIWAGSSTLNLTVVDENNAVVPNAAVSIFLSDNSDVGLKAKTNANGLVSFANLPQRTILISATVPNKYISSVVAINSTVINQTIKLKIFNPASTIDNNDFSSQTTSGWDIGGAPVSIVAHDETPGFDNAITNLNDYDLRLTTSGQGPQSISRTFTTKPTTKKVNIRYRFITSEVPGGYYGTQFNDYFSVRLRSQSTNGISSEENSMNGLGLGAFNYSTGATAWRTVVIPVNNTPNAAGSENVQVELTVANVADGLFNSNLEADVILEGKLAILSANLKDKQVHTTNNQIGIEAIKRLSLDSENPYLSNRTYVWGTIKLQGEPGDVLTSVRLKVLNNGAEVGVGELSATAGTALLKTFGPSGILEITSDMRLFEIPVTATPATADITYQLKIEARSQSGESAFLDDETRLQNGKVVAFTRFKGTNRFGKRELDKPRGGDDWGKPSVISLVNSFPAGWQVNDISDMNGGTFPPHDSHMSGKSIDCYFNGYIEMVKTKVQPYITKAATAQELINYLNSAQGKYVRNIYATYKAGSPFETLINTTKLSNGNFANTKIGYWDDHYDHFHVEMNENTSAALTSSANLLARRQELSLMLTNNKSHITNTGDSFFVQNSATLEADKSINLILKLQETPSAFAMKIYDIDGVLIKAYETLSLQKGENTVTIQGKDIPKQGEYIVVIKTSADEYKTSFTMF